MTASPPTRRYTIQHQTVYSYSDDVTASYGRGFLRPRDLSWQRCLSHRVTTRPTAADSSVGVDVYGNNEFYFHVTATHRRLEVLSDSVVEVRSPEVDLATLDVPWERARPQYAGEADAVDFVLPSPRVDVTEEVRRFAADSFVPGRAISEAVLDLNSRIHREFTYKTGATTVGTRVPDVLADRAGVCQDFAHLAVACLRAMGLAGRYVSGYLATDPPPGRQRMIGVDASHAWAAVWLPGGSWLAFDPTNNQVVDVRHTTVAWGRDYADVPPLRGVIFTDADRSEMKVSVDVAPAGISDEGSSEPLFGQ